MRSRLSGDFSSQFPSGDRDWNSPRHDVIGIRANSETQGRPVPESEFVEFLSSDEQEPEEEGTDGETDGAVSEANADLAVDGLASADGDVEPEGETGEEPLRLSQILKWLTLMLVTYVALLLIEYQIHPAVPAVLLCFKLCFGDLLDAWWVARRDPDRDRGRIVGLWYVTRAMWHVGAWAFFLLLVIYAVAVMFIFPNQGMGNPGQNGVDVHTVGKALVATFLAMFGMALVMTYVVVVWATVVRQPVWLGKGLSYWRRRDRFPPFVGGKLTSPNDAVSLTTVVTFTVGAGGAAASIWALILLQFQLGPWLGNPGQALVSVVLVLLTMIAPVGILVATMIRGASLTRPTIALSPKDCWVRAPRTGPGEAPRASIGSGV